MKNAFRCNACEGVYFDVGDDGAIYTHVCGIPIDDKLDNTPDRPIVRDENIDLTRTGVLRGIVSEGLGVKCLTSDLLKEPPWITRMKRSIPAESE